MNVVNFGLIVYIFFVFVSGCPTVLVPAKVVQALNLNFDDMNGHVQPRFYTGFTSDQGKPVFYVTFMA